MNNPFSLEEKTILVTGASSGIGKATALLCADMGARVVVIARNEERLLQTTQSIASGEHIAICIDYDKEETIDEAIAKIPNINGVVNCAGIVEMAPFQFIERKNMEQVFNTNFFAPVMLINKLLKSKKLQKESSIVFVSSIDGAKIIHAGNSVYAASKTAIIGMARNMAIDLASKKIRVNSVLPGTTNTPMIHTENVTEEMLQEKAKTLPLKRFAEPSEVASAIVFLLSNASSYITGTELVVDGGNTLVR